jgi:Co/Zn/Cd efflux system component
MLSITCETCLAFLLLASTLRTANVFNSPGLLLISGVIVWQAFNRLFHPQPVLGIVPIVAGLLAAAGNWGIARSLREPSKEDVAWRTFTT